MAMGNIPRSIVRNKSGVFWAFLFSSLLMVTFSVKSLIAEQEQTVKPSKEGVIQWMI